MTACTALCLIMFGVVLPLVKRRKRCCEGLGVRFRDRGLGLRVCAVEGAGCRVWGVGCGVQGACRV